MIGLAPEKPHILEKRQLLEREIGWPQRTIIYSSSVYPAVHYFKPIFCQLLLKILTFSVNLNATLYLKINLLPFPISVIEARLMNKIEEKNKIKQRC